MRMRMRFPVRSAVPDEEEEKRGAGLQCEECCAFVDSCGVESRRGRFDGFYDGYQI